MSQFPNDCKDKGIEIALSPHDLSIEAYCQIYEKKSTTGFREKPLITPPQTNALTNRMIQFDQPWCVEFFWKINGPLACLLDCGYWKCHLLFEKIGGGEVNYQPEVMVQDLGIPGQEYTAVVNIPPHTLPKGVYHVICCLQFCFKDGQPGPIAGFEDKGLIKIYVDKQVPKPVVAENGSANGGIRTN